MTKAADPNLEPFIDDLWYFNSVVSTKPPFKPAKPNPAAAVDEKSVEDDHLASFSESQLPLSTGGESSPRAASYSSYYTDPGSDSEARLCGDGGICVSCKSSGGRPSMCELVDRIEDDESELTAADLRLWMQKLGLEYTDDGAMIRRIPNMDFGSQQKLDFSEFVCLNRFIEEEHSSPQHGEHNTRFSDAHMASLHEVFRLFDKDNSGLISPSDLCAALTKLGLRRAS